MFFPFCAKTWVLLMYLGGSQWYCGLCPYLIELFRPPTPDKFTEFRIPDIEITKGASLLSPYITIPTNLFLPDDRCYEEGDNGMPSYTSFASITTQTDCDDICLQDPRCLSSSFSYINNECFLKDKAERMLTPSMDTVHQPKYCSKKWASFIFSASLILEYLSGLLIIQTLDMVKIPGGSPNMF